MNQRGFSLAEMMIALAVTSVLAIVTASVITTSQTQTLGLEAKQEFMDLRQDINVSFKNKGVCTKNLAGYDIGPNPADLPNILNFDASGVQTQVLAAADTKVRNLYIERMWVEHKAAYSSNREAANLVISARLTNATGQSLQPQKIPLFVKTEGGKIVECTSADRSTIVSSQQICAINNMIFDSVTQKCKEPPFDWIRVGSLSGGCPNNRMVSPFIQEPCDCYSPPGWTDPMAFKATYTAKSGATQVLETGPGAFQLAYEKSTGICTCHLANDISPSGWSVAIACLQEIPK